MASWTPRTPLATVVDLAGFAYDSDQDIIYSKMDALQRNFGYAYAFDANALLLSADIDCEPIFFDYDNKLWMIELWKAQYGLETGCEIGVYNRPTSAPVYYGLLDQAIGRRDIDPDPRHGQFFRCADDTELLEMRFTLLRNGESFVVRGPERHWWLTGFRWGVFSKPEDLVMQLSIVFPTEDMRRAFVQALQTMGYQPTQDGLTVSFDFKSPLAAQPPKDATVLTAVRYQNAAIVNTYNDLKKQLNIPNNDPNAIVGQAVNEVAASSLNRGPESFGRIVAESLQRSGRDVREVAGLLIDQLQFAAESVAEWITDAGYRLAQWLESAYVTVKNLTGMDFGCAVEMVNLEANGQRPALLTLTGCDIRIRPGLLWGEDTCGRWGIRPPSTILPGERRRFYLLDNPGVRGAEGWAEYSYVAADGRTESVRFDFGCPTGTDTNYARVGPSSSYGVWARSGGDSTWHSPVPEWHHPLQVAYVWGHGPAPA